MKRFPIPALVAGAAVLWGVLLVLVWAIHPIEVSAEFIPVEDPSTAEQASIDEVFGEFDGEQPKMFNRFECDNSPLEAATGAGGVSLAPTPPIGFEYVDTPCSAAYDSASAAFWINAIVIAAIVVASLAFHLRLRKRPSEGPAATGVSPAQSLVDT